MRVGRRVLRFWIYLFLVCGTGCAGCDNCCEGNGGCNFGFDGDGGGCNSVGIGCDGGWCTSGNNPYDSSYPQSDGGFHDAIRAGIVAPGGLATDGVELFYVDDGVLTQIENDGSSPVILATGVDASGGLVSDGVNVYWSGGWSGGDDGGTLDAGDDAGASDDGGDGGDAGGAAIARNPGIYAVPVNGGDIIQVASATTLPTLAIDENNAYARVLEADAGTETLAAVALSGDGGLVPLAALTDNAGNMHAFALRASDIVAMDQNDIVSVPFDGGAKSTLEPNAGSSQLLATDLGAASIFAASHLVSLHVVGEPDAGSTFSLDLGPVASRGVYVYVADARGGNVYRFDVEDLSAYSQVASWPPSSTLLYLAADDQYVYLLTMGGSGGVISRASLF